jgi:hypothetical protein
VCVCACECGAKWRRLASVVDIRYCTMALCVVDPSGTSAGSGGKEGKGGKGGKGKGGEVGEEEEDESPVCSVAGRVIGGSLLLFSSLSLSLSLSLSFPFFDDLRESLRSLKVVVVVVVVVVPSAE